MTIKEIIDRLNDAADFIESHPERAVEYAGYLRETARRIARDDKRERAIASATAKIDMELLVEKYKAVKT